MADFKIKDVALYVSKPPEASLNTAVTTGANFLKVLTQQTAFLLPQVEYVDDAGRAGNGHEFPTYQCATYLSHPAISITDDINVSYAGRLLLRAVGGTVTTAQQEDTDAYKHSAKMLLQSTSVQLPSSTFISSLGGATFRFDGMVVDRYRLSQNRADRPQFQADLVGTGKFVTPHGVTSLPGTANILECLDGSNTVCTWTDRVGAKNFASGACRLRSISVEIANNTVLNDRCAGDPKVTITESASGTSVQVPYVQTLTHGDRTITAQMVILLDSTIPQWYTYATNDELTDFTIRFQGSIIETTYRNSIGVVFSKARIKAVTPVESEGKAALQIDITGFWDDADQTVITAEIFNEETADYA